MADYWMKLYIEILDDPKMATLPDRVWRRVIELFLVAKRLGKDGHLPDTRQIAWMLRMSPDELDADLAQVEHTGIIEREVGGWFIPKFAQRQAPVPDAERKAQERDRKKSRQYYGDVTSSSRNVTQSTEDRLTEAETEKQSPAASQAALSPDTIALSVYTGVTGFMAYPGGMEKNATKLWQFARSHGGIAQAVEYLKPFYTTWTGRKTKDGRAYSRTGDGWIDWAIAGECPPETVKPEDKPLSGRESRRRLLTGV